MRSIVFLDLDNTLWTNEGVPASASQAIRGAQDGGHLVFSNTGRSRAECRDLAPYGLTGRCYAAGAEAFLGAEKIVDEPLGPAASRRMLETLDIGTGILIAEGGDRCFVRAYDRAYFDELHAELRRVGDPFLDHEDIGAMTEADHGQIYKYSLFVAGGVPDEIIAAIPHGYTATTMGDATEFTQSHLTKASILDTVRDVVETRTGERWQTVAVGDSGNDLPMLRRADISVSMGNGTAEAKAAADYVTRDINDDGLAHAFAHLGLC